MSSPAIRERIQRREETGVITGYRLEISPRALGYPIAAFVRIRPMPGKLPKIAELAARMPQVVECYRITGEDCFLLKVYLETLDSLDQILDQFLAYGQSTTSSDNRHPASPWPATARREARLRTGWRILFAFGRSSTTVLLLPSDTNATRLRPR